MTRVTIVGGGLSGMIAAIEVVERGGEAVVHERSQHLGGRARTSGSRYRVNFGPHALYADGVLWKWLKARGLLPPTRMSNPLSVRFVSGGKARRGVPMPVWRAMRLSLRDAPADLSYRDWIARFAPGEQIDAICRIACFYSFAADPGALSATFVNERNARLVRPPSPARFVSAGGWQAIVDRLEAHARRLGVQIETGHRVHQLPDRPVIVATELSAAAELLGESLSAPKAEAVLLDLALTSRPGEPSAVLDLDGGAFVERYTAFDEGLAPRSQHLLQCHAGLAPGELPESAVARIETALDLTFMDWRQREQWRAVRRSEGRSGAVEVPGVDWSKRPAIDRGDRVFLVGDAVAAPGLLAEVAVNSAIEAAAGALSSWPAGGDEGPVVRALVEGRRPGVDQNSCAPAPPGSTNPVS